MRINHKNIQSDISNFVEATRLVYQSDKWLFVARLGLIAIQSALPLVSLYVLKLLVDEVTRSIVHPNSVSINTIWWYTGVFCGVFLLTRLAGIINSLCDELLGQKLVDNISQLLHKKSAELDLEFYDNAAYHDTFHRAQQEATYRPMQVLNNLSGLFGNGLSLVGIVAILFSFSWLGIAIMVVAGLPSLVVKLVKSKTLYTWRKENTPLARKANYFSMLLTNRTYAKEVRTYNLATHFQNQYSGIRKTFMIQIRAILYKLASLDMISVLFEAGALLAIIYLLSSRAFTGAITIGSFVMLFEAFRRGQGVVQGLVSNLSGIYENKLFLTNLFEFLGLQPRIQSPVVPVPFPKHIVEGIRFENVSFAYPGSSKMVVTKLNLVAKPGEISLIEGENGAGKTTMIKLLCRLYDCTEGAIYIEGINIKDFDVKELRKNISVMFQDFAQYNFTAQENIRLGDVDKAADTQKMAQASHLGCAAPVIEQLPLQYDTLLGKYFEHGEELSMGQWQRVALARTIYKDAPILVLDEPTSWMDAKIRKQFDHNLSLLKEGKILLLISHTRQKEFENIKTDSFTESNYKKQLVSI